MAKPTEIQGLSAAMPATAAAVAMVEARLRDVQRHADRLRKKPDADGVHDTRVATRRLRAALELFERRGHLHGASRKVKRLQDALGAVRDAQVELTALKGLGDGLGDGNGMDRGLKDALDSGLAAELAQRSAELLTALDRWRDEDVGAVSTALASLRAAGKLGGHRMRKRLRRRLKQLELRVDEALPDLSAGAAHRLRIAGKRTRYELELLAPAFPEIADVLLPELEALQGALGDLHDCDVQLDHLLLVHAASDQEDDRVERSALVTRLASQREARARLVRERLTRLHADRSLKALRARLKKRRARAPGNEPPAASPG